MVLPDFCCTRRRSHLSTKRDSNPFLTSVIRVYLRFHPACRKPLRQNTAQHLAVDIREAEIAAAETIGEPFMIEAEQVQDGRP